MRALRRVVDIFRPAFDEESAANPAHNTQILWRELFGRDIHVRATFIAPALAGRRQSCKGSAGGLKNVLGRIQPSGDHDSRSRCWTVCSFVPFGQVAVGKDPLPPLSLPMFLAST